MTAIQHDWLDADRKVVEDDPRNPSATWLQ
jgi:hypothetical protein